MIRRCDGTDRYLQRKTGGEYIPCTCGAEFDDVDWSVIYPHPQIHGLRTLVELGKARTLPSD